MNGSPFFGLRLCLTSRGTVMGKVTLLEDARLGGLMWNCLS